MWLDCGTKQAFLPLFQIRMYGSGLFLGTLEMVFIRKVSIDIFVIRFLINIVYS
jgi:hypothetical protein